MTVGNRAGCALSRGIGIPLRDLGLEFLHRHAWRKRHRLFPKPSDVELMRRRRVEDEFAPLLQRGPVERHDIEKRGRRAEQVVALAASGIVGRQELRTRVDSNAHLRFAGGRLGLAAPAWRWAPGRRSSGAGGAGRAGCCVPARGKGCGAGGCCANAAASSRVAGNMSGLYVAEPASIPARHNGCNHA